MVERLRKPVGEVTASVMPYEEVDAVVDGVNVKRCVWPLEHSLLPKHRNILFASPYMAAVGKRYWTSKKR